MKNMIAIEGMPKRIQEEMKKEMAKNMPKEKVIEKIREMIEVKRENTTINMRVMVTQNFFKLYPID